MFKDAALMEKFGLAYKEAVKIGAIGAREDLLLFTRHLNMHIISLDYVRLQHNPICR